VSGLFFAKLTAPTFECRLTLESTTMSAGGKLECTNGDGQEETAFTQEVTAFTEEDLTNIRTILSKPEDIHSCDKGSAKDHAQHCLQQLVRFAHLANKGLGFRGTQWGRNLGRAQEILDAFGGLKAWWRAFEPHIEAGDWHRLETLSRTYIDLFQLEQPSVEFINKA
jgi:hypothetical protein